MPGEPLDIFITDPHTRGGGQITYITRLAGALTALGHRVTLGCRPGSLLANAAEATGSTKLDTFHFARGLRIRPWLSDIKRLRQYFRDARPQIIHVNGSQDHWACAVAMRGMRNPACLVRTRHNTYTVKNSAVNRMLNRKWTDYQIVVCDVVRKDLARQAPFRSERMCTIHNGVDAERFKPDPAARAALRKELGYADDDMVCALIGRLTPAKGHQILLKAAAKLVSEYPNLKLLFIGEGELDEHLRVQAREMGLKECTHFAGYQEDMRRWVQAVDIGVQPSIDCDTSSFSLKEMMAAEKPVVTSNYGGLTEIVRDGVEGLVARAGEHMSLAAALHRLFDDPKLRQRFGAAGRRRVLDEFTVDVFARRTVEAYRRALALHAPKGGGA